MSSVKSGKAYKISDQPPEVHGEKQCRHRQILAANRALSKADQQEMSVKKEKLLINHSEYKKKVQSVPVWELLNFDDCIEDVSKIRVAGGHSKSERGSQFTVYAAATNTLTEVHNVLTLFPPLYILYITVTTPASHLSVLTYKFFLRQKQIFL